MALSFLVMGHDGTEDGSGKVGPVSWEIVSARWPSGINLNPRAFGTVTDQNPSPGGGSADHLVVFGTMIGAMGVIRGTADVEYTLPDGSTATREMTTEVEVELVGEDVGVEDVATVVLNPHSENPKSSGESAQTTGDSVSESGSTAEMDSSGTGEDPKGSASLGSVWETTPSNEQSSSSLSTDSEDPKGSAEPTSLGSADGESGGETGSSDGVMGAESGGEQQKEQGNGASEASTDEGNDPKLMSVSPTNASLAPSAQSSMGGFEASE